MKKIVVGFLLLMLIFTNVLLIDCGAKAKGEEVNLNNKTITIWGGAHLSTVTEIVLKDFCAKHPGLKVICEKYPYAQYPTKMRLQLSAGEKVPDIMIIHDFIVPQFVKAGWLLDLTNKIPKNDLLDNFQAVSLKGKRYGVPNQSSTVSLMYRKDLFERFNLKAPATFDEYLKTAQFLKQKGYFIDAYDPSRDAHTLYLTFVYLLGGEVFDKTGKVILDTNAGKGVQALQMLKKVVDMKVLHTSQSYMSDAYWTAFNNGEIASLLGPSYIASYFDTNMDPKGKGGYGAWRMTLPPHMGTFGPKTYQPGTEYYVINKRSAEPAAAWKVIEYLTQTVEAGQKFTEVNKQGTMVRMTNSYIPSLKNLEMKSYQWPIFGNQMLLSDVAKTLIETHARIPYSYGDVRTEEMQRIIDTELGAFFANKNASVPKTIQEIAKKIRDIQID